MLTPGGSILAVGDIFLAGLLLLRRSIVAGGGSIVAGGGSYVVGGSIVAERDLLLGGGVYC